MFIFPIYNYVKKKVVIGVYAELWKTEYTFTAHIGIPAELFLEYSGVRYMPHNFWSCALPINITTWSPYNLQKTHEQHLRLRFELAC